MTTGAVASVVPKSHTSRWPVFGWFAFLFLIASQVTAIAISPPDRDMGASAEDHVRARPGGVDDVALATSSCSYFGVRYLWKRREEDDLLAASAAEVGATFSGLTLVLGMIWARPTWGVWWTWDARLTSTLVLFLMFVGYLALRAFIDDAGQTRAMECGGRRARRINVPIVYMSVRWWRTIHQIQSSPATVDPRVYDGPATERVRDAARDDLLRAPAIRGRAAGARGGTRELSGRNGTRSRSMSNGCSSARRSPSRGSCSSAICAHLQRTVRRARACFERATKAGSR